MNIADLRRALAAGLRSRKSSVVSEVRIQGVIADALAAVGVEALREHRFSPADRVDFFIPSIGMAIEVKKGGASTADLRQIGRYLAYDECRGCMVIAMRVEGIPVQFQGKTIERIELWKLLL